MIRLEEGKCYFIETFGKHYVGRVREVTHTEVVLEDAAWVADSGRLHAFLRNGRTDNMEIEPVGVVDVPLAYVSAKYPWPHPLFTEAV